MDLGLQERGQRTPCFLKTCAHTAVVLSHNLLVGLVMKWKPYLQRPNSRSQLKEWKVGQGHHVMHEWFRYFEHVEERHLCIYIYSPQVNGELVVEQPMEVRVILNLHPKQVEPIV